MKKLIKLFIPPILLNARRRWRKKHTLPPRRIEPVGRLVGSYSQYGEDMILDNLVHFRRNGFYVDVGAHDPNFQSNTKRFYDRGWRGINIEPMVSHYRRFTEDRPRDININCGVHDHNAELTFYELEWETLSTFNQAKALESARDFNCKITAEYVVPVRTLSDIFRTSLPAGQDIDFMSVDTEGHDVFVLMGNQWSRFRPALILIESGDRQQEIHKLLGHEGYELVYRNQLNFIYRDTALAT